MPIGIELVHKRPSTSVPWVADFVAAQTDPSYDAVKTSYNTYMDAYNNSSFIRRQNVYDESADPLTLKVQFSVNDLPTDDLEKAYLFLRKKQKELYDSINDAPYTESAEESFDGVPRVFPRCLFVDFSRRYYLQNGLSIAEYRFVDVDF